MKGLTSTSLAPKSSNEGAKQVSALSVSALSSIPLFPFRTFLLQKEQETAAMHVQLSTHLDEVHSIVVSAPLHHLLYMCG